MAGLPALLRDLLSKLPPLGPQQPPQEVEGFLRFMKSVVLPPRPSEEAVLLPDEANGGNNGPGDTGEHFTLNILAHTLHTHYIY